MQQQMEPRAEDGSSVMQGPRITLSNVLKGESAIAKVKLLASAAVAWALHCGNAFTVHGCGCVCNSSMHSGI